MHARPCNEEMRFSMLKWRKIATADTQCLIVRLSLHLRLESDSVWIVRHLEVLAFDHPILLDVTISRDSL